MHILLPILLKPYWGQYSVPQGSVLGLFLFIVMKCDLDVSFGDNDNVTTVFT